MFGSLHPSSKMYSYDTAKTQSKKLFTSIHSLVIFSTKGRIVIFYSLFIFKIYIKYETSSNGSIQSEGNSEMFSTIS